VGKMTITFLGARGTAPVDDPQFSEYGGATLCILLSAGGQHILLDGGSGLSALPDRLSSDAQHVHLLISHPHADHMSGIPVCPTFFSGRVALHLYAVPRGGLGAEAQLRCLMSPPLWPVGPEIFTPPVLFTDIVSDFSIGPVDIRVMEGSHPGGCSVFRLEYGAQSLVYAPDFEHTHTHTGILDFARDCSLLLFDGHYSNEELPRMKGFGHSSWAQAARLALDCGAQRLGIIHHAPWRTDRQLDVAQSQLQQIMPNSFFAKKGACIEL